MNKFTTILLAFRRLPGDLAAKNSIDNDSNPPQYLDVNVAAGDSSGHARIRLQGKIVHGGNFMPAKKKAAKKKKH